MSGYSAPFVALLLRNYDSLLAGTGLPKKEWQLATRVQRSRWGGASWEMSIALKADLERGLAKLNEVSRNLLLTAHRSGHATAKLYSQRPTARTAKLRTTVDGILDQLVRVMNGGLQDMPTKPTNGTQAATEPTKAEQPAADLHAAIEAKLARLPDDWQELHIKRGMAGSYQIRAVY